MANIATLLARILTTRYGRDMRQDLHDSIEAVNDDTETALGKKLTFTTNTRKLKLLAKDDTVLSEVVIPGGGSGGGSVDSVNGLFPDENGNVELNLDDINDVDITSAEDGDALVYYATSGKWVNGNIPIPIDLSDLSDVDTSGVTDGQILKYNATSGKFLPSNESGGGTTDYTNLSNKPSINGVTLSGNKTSADLGISGGSNENLIENAWFTINQKGTTSGNLTTASKLIDRWELSSVSASYSLDSNGLALTVPTEGNVSITQYSEDFIKLVGKQLTASIMFSDGSVTNGTVTLTNDANTVFVNDGNVRIRYLKESGNVRSLQFTLYNTVTIRAVKLEIGSESTLALDTTPDYASELLKCQRYFYPLSGKSYNAMVSAMQQTRQFMTITLPTEMRAVPTFNGSLSTEGISGSTRVENTVTSSNITVTKTQDIDFNFTTSGNYNLCSSARVDFASGSYLSAEL